MVGPARFELATSCTPSKRASQAALRPDKSRSLPFRPEPDNFHLGEGRIEFLAVEVLARLAPRHPAGDLLGAPLLADRLRAADRIDRDLDQDARELPVAHLHLLVHFQDELLLR